MRVIRAIAGAALAAAALTPVGTAPHPAHAAPNPNPAINGTYRAVSNGAMAKRNHQMKDQDIVTATWTVVSTCSTPVDCKGQVTSDQGWRANLNLVGGSLWIASHDVENWERCPDGSAFPGHQQFKFFPVDDNNLRGWDETQGPSGACGANQWLLIEMPFTLAKIG